MPYVIVSTVALLSNLYKNAPLIVGDKDSDPDLMRFLGARITTNYPACGSPAMYVMHAPPRTVFDNLEKKGYCLMCSQIIQEHSVWLFARPRVPDDDKMEISRGGPNDKSIQAFEENEKKNEEPASSNSTPKKNTKEGTKRVTIQPKEGGGENNNANENGKRKKEVHEDTLKLDSTRKIKKPISDAAEDDNKLSLRESRRQQPEDPEDGNKGLVRENERHTQNAPEDDNKHSLRESRRQPTEAPEDVNRRSVKERRRQPLEAPDDDNKCCMKGRRRQSPGAPDDDCECCMKGRRRKPPEAAEDDNKLSLRESRRQPPEAAEDDKKHSLRESRRQSLEAPDDDNDCCMKRRRRQPPEAPDDDRHKCCLKECCRQPPEASKPQTKIHAPEEGDNNEIEKERHSSEDTNPRATKKKSNKEPLVFTIDDSFERGLLRDEREFFNDLDESPTSSSPGFLTGNERKKKNRSVSPPSPERSSKYRGDDLAPSRSDSIDVRNLKKIKVRKDDKNRTKKKSYVSGSQSRTTPRKEIKDNESLSRTPSPNTKTMAKMIYNNESPFRAPSKTVSKKESVSKPPPPPRSPSSRTMPKKPNDSQSSSRSSSSSTKKKKKNARKSPPRSPKTKSKKPTNPRSASQTRTKPRKGKDNESSSRSTSPSSRKKSHTIVEFSYQPSTSKTRSQPRIKKENVTPAARKGKERNVTSKGDASSEGPSNEKVHTRTQVYDSQDSILNESDVSSKSTGMMELQLPSTYSLHSVSSAHNVVPAVLQEGSKEPNTVSRGTQAQFSATTLVFCDGWETDELGWSESGVEYHYNSSVSKKKGVVEKPLMLDTFTQVEPELIPVFEECIAQQRRSWHLYHNGKEELEKKPKKDHYTIYKKESHHIHYKGHEPPSEAMRENPVFSQTDPEHLSCLTRGTCCCEENFPDDKNRDLDKQKGVRMRLYALHTLLDSLPLT